MFRRAQRDSAISETVPDTSTSRLGRKLTAPSLIGLRKKNRAGIFPRRDSV